MKAAMPNESDGAFPTATSRLLSGPRSASRLDAALDSVQELRDAVAAAMRVIADLDMMKQCGAELDTRAARFAEELKLAGVRDGFGKRADELLKECGR